MSIETLEELKAKNAAEAEQAGEVTATESEDDDLDADDVDSDADGIDADQPEGKADAESEDWMNGDQAPNGSDKKVPLATLINVREKFKGRLEKQQSESEQTIAAMKAEIDALKSGSQHATHNAATIKPPKLEDYYDDQPAYERAMEAYVDAKVDARLSNSNKSAEAKQKHEQASARLNEALENHYQRAASLAEKSGITDEQYRAADTNLRIAVNQVMPNRGDAVVDTLLANLGEGSEKVGYWLGVNQKAREELQAKLASDPSGLSVSVWLGKKLGELTAPKKLRSSAAKPNTQLNSDAKPNDSLKALKDKINKARSSGDMQKVIDLRSEARKAGIDTKTL